MGKAEKRVVVSAEDVMGGMVAGERYTLHDIARRVDAAYLATLVAQDRLPLDEAAETIVDLAYHLPKKVFRL